jgi:hypothetical protein
MTSRQAIQSPTADSEWPKQVDYSLALQNPDYSLIGDSVKGCRVVRTPKGRHMMWSGSYAAVYQLERAGTYSVIRCFTSPVSDQKNRYDRLDKFFKAHSLDCLVRFEYLDEGILVEGKRYPLVEMAFVEGENLRKFVGRKIEEGRGREETLSKVAENWQDLNSKLRNLEVAHNDLQHGNVMIQDDLEILLIDYDGFFVPDSVCDGVLVPGTVGDNPEGGHGNYQHPLRKISDYNEHVDNFPALVIYLSLLALAYHPNLWDKNKDKQLLFAEQDFKAPSSSDCFRELKGSPEKLVSRLTHYLERYCSVPVEHVPNLITITSVANADQEDPPLAQAATRVVNPQTASLPVGQPKAPASGVQPPPSTQPQRPQQSGAVNPASVAGHRRQWQAARRPSPGPAAAVGQQATAPQTQQASSLTSTIAGTVNCSRGHPNDATLIYCDIEQCAVVLYDGNEQCKGCRYVYPANARFCPQCANELS